MKNIKRLIFLTLILLFIVIGSACTPPVTPPTTQPSQGAQATTVSTQIERSSPNEIILATTTSTRDSGLLDVLLPIFEKESGLTVKMIAVGTGQALKMGEMGNADVLLVHAPKSEEEYMKNGFGKERLLVMHNDFILVGSKDDPAKIKGAASPSDALKLISGAKAKFVSRGDDSGTHKAELALWSKAQITPSKADEWYIQTGQGMGDTLRVASELSGYTLSDRATYLAQKAKIQLEILLEGDKSLYNIYHVITVNPEKFPLINATGGKSFADFMVAPGTQKIIGEFGKDKYGEPLFFPDAGKE